MKKIYIIFSCILLNVLVLSSCKPTPNIEIVQAKNIATDNITLPPQTEILTSRLNVPKDWREEINPNKKLLLYFDANILVPDVKDVSTYKVEPQQITQEMANQYIKNIFGDAKIYQQQPPNVITQEDILNDVKRIQNYLEQIKKIDLARYNKELPDWNKTIKEELDNMKNLPATYTLQLSDGIFKIGKKFVDVLDNLNPDIKKINIQGDLGNEYPATLDITQSESFKDGNVSFLNGMHKNMTDIKLKIDEVKNPINLTIPLSEAEEVASNELKRLGFENFCLQDAYYGVQGLGPYVTTSVPAKDTNPYFYDLYFTQKINTIPLSYTSPFRTPTTNENFSEGWEPEVIQVFVDNDGVFVVNWLAPTKISDKIDENVKLLDFNKIKRIVLQNLSSIYTPVNVEDYIVKVSLNIKKIEFAYVKCLKQNSDSEYILTPCWNIYGSIQTFYNEKIKDPNYDANNSNTEEKPMGTLISVNAINGSLINTDMGF